MGRRLETKEEEEGAFIPPPPESYRWPRGTPGTRGGQSLDTQSRAPGGPGPRAPGVVRELPPGDRAPRVPGPRAPGVLREYNQGARAPGGPGP